MDSDEIRARLAAAIPSGNISWTDEDQAAQLLPVVAEIVADVVAVERAQNPRRMRRRDVDFDLAAAWESLDSEPQCQCFPTVGVPFDSYCAENGCKPPSQ